MRLLRLSLPLVAFVLSACAYEVGFDAGYVTEDAPGYVADAEIVVLTPPVGSCGEVTVLGVAPIG